MDDMTSEVTQATFKLRFPAKIKPIRECSRMKKMIVLLAFTLFLGGCAEKSESSKNNDQQNDSKSGLDRH
jgi:uncharacterized lipoprotein YajG